MILAEPPMIEAEPPSHGTVLRACEASLPTVIALTEGPEVERVAGDLGRYLAIDGLLLLRKALIARVEALLAEDGRSTRVTRWAAPVFRRWRADHGARSHRRERWHVRSLWAALLLRALAMPLARGIALRSSGLRRALGVPDKWGPPNGETVHHDLLLVDGRRFTERDVLVLAESDRHVAAYRRRGIDVLPVRRAPVPIGAWLRDVLPRVAVLVVRRVAAPVGTAAGWLASLAAWEQAWRSLDWECIAARRLVKVVLDVEEQNPAHAVKTAVFGRHGARTLRVPHTQPDTPGNHTSFWMYHVIAVSSEYVAREYGATWWRGTRVEPVGLIFNSALNGHPSSTAPALAEVRARGPVLAMFTGSAIGVQPLIHRALARVAAEALAAHPSLQLVIKPKPAHAGLLADPGFREPLAPFLDAGRVTVLEPDGVWCSAQALLAAAAACLTYGGSVVQEAITWGVPVLVYPVVPGHETRWTTAFQGQVVFDSPAAILAALDEILNGSRPGIDDTLVHDYCDPFRDGRALDRVTALARDLVDAP